MGPGKQLTVGSCWQEGGWSVVGDNWLAGGGMTGRVSLEHGWRGGGRQMGAWLVVGQLGTWSAGGGMVGTGLLGACLLLGQEGGTGDMSGVGQGW